MTALPFSAWFREHTGFAPHPWQARLAERTACDDRLIRIPTGMGKTLGVLAAWSYHRLVRADPTWPRRLVLCLPMRTLVEQTEAVVQAWLRDLGRLWSPGSDEPSAGEVGVHLLLGGARSRAWHLYPEHNAVLVGTQDMLLSRALNRGYGSPRGRWPMEQALLRQDALWVLDEVQLMDVGLRTSVQLRAFARDAAPRTLRPVRSWWMSATLQPSWLGSVDFAGALPELREHIETVPPEERSGPLFAATKPLRVGRIAAKEDRAARRWAQAVLEAHRATPLKTSGRLTLAITNTVRDASALFDALRRSVGQTKAKKEVQPELQLVHSRFRGRERGRWREAFLNREACSAGADRIIVATQVVEAGVDISADALVTALAPWPSLVQRFGRAARYGGSATIHVIDRDLDERSAAPYEVAELDAAREVLARREDVGLGTLEALEEELGAEDPALLERLYPYAPLHTLTREEYADLFDTGPDLTGSDLDISRFIRSGEERDLQLWWWPVEGDAPGPDLQPVRDALCPAPVTEVRAWLTRGAKGSSTPRAWSWSYVDGAWRRVQRAADLFPGQLILVDAADGGYLTQRGFVGAESRTAVPCDPADLRPRSGRMATFAALLHSADNAQGHEDLSALEGYKSIAYHGHEAGAEARALARAFALPEPLSRVLDLAARAHDLGKAHPVFQAAIAHRSEVHRGATDLAKAPQGAWRRERPTYSRPGFRHELASALGLLEALYQAAPAHPGLLGEHRKFVEQGLLRADRQHLEGERPEPEGLLAELTRLDADDLNLALYLVCAHHGKVRGSWQATPQDQEARPDPERGLPLRGVLAGDRLPPTPLADSRGAPTGFPGVTLHLDPAALGLSPRYGASWRERVDRLRRRHGDGTLALLETLLRVADVRASMRSSVDPWILEERAR